MKLLYAFRFTLYEALRCFDVLAITVLNILRLARFSTEKILAEELCKITEALEAKDVDQKSIFLKGNINSKIMCAQIYNQVYI